MAGRPIFIPRLDGTRLVAEVTIEFGWHSGFAPSQKRKNVDALHKAAKLRGFNNVLEVSTKSDEKIGIRLSAFNLKVELPEFGSIPLECVYQGSKVFSNGGPYLDLYEKDPRDAKRDERLRMSGPLIGFRLNGISWSLEPKTAFYDWLYISSLYDFREFLKRLYEYDGFSDIEFNPEKSLNCQARSCAILVSLMRKDLLTKAMRSPEDFISVLRPDSFSQPHSTNIRQGQLL